jgi:hypothetical protein
MFRPHGYGDFHPKNPPQTKMAAWPQIETSEIKKLYFPVFGFLWSMTASYSATANMTIMIICGALISAPCDPPAAGYGRYSAVPSGRSRAFRRGLSRKTASAYAW